MRWKLTINLDCVFELMKILQVVQTLDCPFTPTVILPGVRSVER